MANKQDLQPTMGDLLQKVASPVIVEVGQKVEGEIIFVSKHQVILEIDNVGIGVVRGKEVYNEEYLSRLKVGEKVEAIVLDLDNELGMLELSFRAIGRDQVWADIKDAFENSKPVEAKIRDVNRGGFMMKVHGVDAFLPASLLAPAHAIKQGSGEEYGVLDQMKAYLGHTFMVKIISINEENDSMIVSEKAYSDELAQVKLQKFNVGDVIQGSVVGVVDFGVFVRFADDLEGLVHISEIAWKKVEDPKKFYKVGDEIKARIIEIDNDNRVNLSVKQILPNPWIEFSKQVKVGDKFLGKVSKIISFGAIIVNEEDIQGLCHITQITEDGINNPAKIHEYLKLGETKEFTVLGIGSPEEEKLFLTNLPIDKAKAIHDETDHSEADNDSKAELEETEVNSQDDKDQETEEFKSKEVKKPVTKAKTTKKKDTSDDK